MRVVGPQPLEWAAHIPGWMKVATPTALQIRAELGKDYRPRGVAPRSQSKLLLRQLKRHKPLVYAEIVRPTS